jgi:hypothetical protein
MSLHDILFFDHYDLWDMITASGAFFCMGVAFAGMFKLYKIK